ncbi:MAG: ABC transporter ATP-binding protein [Chloroflexi bacterium]|nr:ABC transporter ATP-binding protein [Chloroflexota bacterium]
MSALSAEALTVRYPGQPTSTPALLEINLQIEPGERLLLLGPNGAGKSTFIRVFAGLMRATRGQARVLGVPARSVRGMVGVVSHATYLYDELSAGENLHLYAELYGVTEPKVRVAALLARVGLTHLADERVGRLSRGQQQRVTIARAFLHDPPVLLLDEPDTGLDLGAFTLLEELTRASDHTLVMTTHNLSSGLRLGTRVGVLAHGRLVHQQIDVSAADGPALASMLERLARS